MRSVAALSAAVGGTFVRRRERKRMRVMEVVEMDHGGGGCRRGALCWKVWRLTKAFIYVA